MSPNYHKWVCLLLQFCLAFEGMAISEGRSEGAGGGEIGGGGGVGGTEEGSGDKEVSYLCYNSTGTSSSSSSSSSNVSSSSPDTIVCKDGCFAYFKYVEEEDNVTSIRWLVRGCWGITGDCEQSTCVSTRQTPIDGYFCCCTGNLCNEDVSLNLSSSQAAAATPPEPATQFREDTIIIIWLVCGICLISFMGFCAVFIFRCRRPKPMMHPIPVKETPNSPCIDLETLKFMEVIGQGRYGKVFRAIVDGEEVAVKTFPPHYKGSFMNEKYIYSIPLMEHPNLLTYLGGGECLNPEGSMCYGLVLSYCHKGRLSSYLAENTLDWPTFCRIVLSATKGLSHLHSDIRKGDVIKPCISHRDFNTRNLLLTEDLTCVVSDLGFALHTQGAKYYVNGEDLHAETSTLTDVGTLRYMSPEVLEGAVNLRDCEAALKQIDIYALGLVLWECAARCHDLYQGLQPPLHMLPFQAEIGLHPSFEQMQVLVVRNKARPLFPPVWKDTNPAIRLLKETIEDCWDHDAEARLSSMCVEGRLSELPTLWDRYKSSLCMNGVSPTINPMSHTVVSQRQGEMFSGLIGNGGKVISNTLTNRDKESSVSEATVETTISSSPPGVPLEHVLGKNELMGSLQLPMPPLQPHQGRNPCMERNLIREVPQEITVSGNTLIDHFKSNDVNSLNTINSVNFIDSLDVQHALESNGFVNEQLMPLLNGHSNTAAPAVQQRSSLPPPNLVPPIPYLQNEVRSIDNQPKRQNTAVMEENQESVMNSGRGSSWRRWRNAWEDRLKSLIPRRQHHHGEDEERQEILDTPTSSSLSEPPTPLTTNQSVVVTSPHMPVQTEVLLTNGGLHTEIGIAKLHLQNGFAPVIRSRQGSKDSGLNKSSENSVSFVDSDNSCEKLKRPTTLSLLEKSHQAVSNEKEKEQEEPAAVAKEAQPKQVLQEMERVCEMDLVPQKEVSPPLRKAKQRVKTPRRPMNPRLSLYDDRIMGCSEGSEGSGRGECKLEESLSHSLPIHMDVLEHQHLSKPVLRSLSNSQDTGSASLRRHSKVVRTSSNNSQGGSSSSSITHPPYRTQQQPNTRVPGDIV